MVIVAIDNDRACLQQLASTLRQIYPLADIVTFADPLSAAQYGFNHCVDIIYTEIVMPRLDGRDIIQFVLHKNPRAKLCFVSQHESLKEEVEKRWNAFFISKPFAIEDLVRGL